MSASDRASSSPGDATSHSVPSASVRAPLAHSRSSGNDVLGQSFGRYEALLRLAAGGMGQVLVARVQSERGVRRLVALKTILAHLTDNELFLKMFVREAEIASRLHPPNVIPVLELGRTDDEHFLVMEYFPSVPLNAVLRESLKRQTPMPPDVAAAIVADAAGGLHAAHELTDDDGNLLHLVHRDATPSNLLIGADGSVKVTDFGVAKATGDNFENMTVSGDLRGKIGYLSPEQVTGEMIDRRSDVFTLGIVLWECLAGRRLFGRKDSEVAAIRALMDEPIPDVREFAPHCTDTLARIVTRALERDCNRRNDIAVIGRDNTVAIYDASGARRWSLPSNRVTAGFMGTVRVVDFSGSDAAPQLLVVRTDASDNLRASLYGFDSAFNATELRSATIPGDSQGSSNRAAIGDFNGDALLDVLFLRSPGAAGTFTASIIEDNGTASGRNWTVVERGITAPMGGCIPPSGASLRVQVFAGRDRDAVAFKQSSGATDGGACIGALTADVIGPYLLWSSSIPSPDTSAVPFVGDIVAGGNHEMIAAWPQTVRVGMSTEVQNTVLVIDALTGATVTSFGTNSAFSTGYLYLGLARLNGVNGPLSVLTTNAANARFVHLHDGTTFQRSAALASLTIDRVPRLLIGPERYGISTGGRAEPIVVETPTGSAILGRSSSQNARLFTVSRDETIMMPAALPGGFVAPRGQRRRAAHGHHGTRLAVGPSPRRRLHSLRRQRRARRGAQPSAVSSLAAVVHERRRPARRVARDADAAHARRDRALSGSARLAGPHRGQPVRDRPSFVASALGCNEALSNSNNALTSAGEFFFTTTSAPITGGNRHLFDRAMNRCQLSHFAVSDIFGTAITGLSLTNDYLRMPLAGAPSSGVLTFAIRDNGANRELYGGIWPLKAPARAARRAPRARAAREARSPRSCPWARQRHSSRVERGDEHHRQ